LVDAGGDSAFYKAGYGRTELGESAIACVARFVRSGMRVVIGGRRGDSAFYQAGYGRTEFGGIYHCMCSPLREKRSAVCIDGGV
jgi:hypothetical protein